ncbi:MAG: tetratricopeptide repeat protein [Ignavibacteriales bacterium]|nr:tetratricopeptide repeat protein [Ignavibacteriales bacterium]
MLNPKKKITKRELKEDALVTTYSKFLMWYEENKKLVSYVTTGVIVLAILIVVFVNNRTANNEKAATELGKVFSYYDAGASDVNQYNLAVNGVPEKNVMGLKAIVDNYGSTSSGELAGFYLANAYYALGKIDDAMNLFDDFSSGDQLLNASATAGVAACYESKGNFAEAASNYEKAAGLQTINTAEYLQSSARCYALKGEKEKALALCKRIKKEFPQSLQARDIDRLIAEYSS